MAPQAIENRMNGNVLLVKILHPLIVMKRSLTLPSVSIINELESDRSLSIILNEKSLNINQLYIISTTSGGNYCNKQQVIDWNGIKGCSCFEINQNISNLAFIHSIWIFGSDRGN